MAKTIHWHEALYAYYLQKSLRGAARYLGVPYSTYGDYFNKNLIDKLDHNFVLTSNYEQISGKSHLFIPDTQCKPGESQEYLRAIGRYIADKKPEVIVHGGDHADMPSLSSYDKGKASAENRRFIDDLDVAKEGMLQLLKPIVNLQREQIRAWLDGEVDEFELYRPKLVITLGNHEDRISRFANDNPAFVGALSTDLLGYESMGFVVVPFLTPITIDGISYIHFVPNPMSGKAMGGSAANILQKVGSSFTMGHRQCLDMATSHNILTGRPKWGLIAGASYPFDEGYKGVTGNKHWRGVVMKHNVVDGDYSPCVVSTDYLLDKYGDCVFVDGENE